MERKFILAVFSAAAILLTMCKCPPCADLVPSASVSWDESTKQVNVTVYNTGAAVAKGFMVYINADENPTSENHRPQIRHRVDSLAACSSITLPLSDFTPLAHIDNSNLENVYQVTVVVDPKNEVIECKSCGENNNTITIPLR
jgi:hypothetical protein